MNRVAKKGLYTQDTQGTQSRRGSFLELALSLREGKGSQLRQNLNFNAFNNALKDNNMYPLLIHR